MNFEEAAKTYFVHARVERMYAPQTLAKIHECFHSWFLPRFSEFGLSDITPLAVLALREKFAERGIGIARQYNLLVVFKLFLRFCRQSLKLDCMDPAEIRLPHRPYRKVAFLTETEVRDVIRVIPSHTYTGLRMRVLIEVLLSTGMRISEALSLDRSCLDSPTGEIEIVGKGSRQRTVFLSPQCMGWMRKLMLFRRDANPAFFVTTGRNPNRLTRDDMSKAFARLRKLSGIKKRLTPHLLRHTFCTNLLHRGADIMFIKELVGHRDIQTTARYYLGVDSRSLRNVLERCQPFGWEQSDRAFPHTRDSDQTPASPPAGQAPNNSGR